MLNEPGETQEAECQEDFVVEKSGFLGRLQMQATKRWAPLRFRHKVNSNQATCYEGGL